VDFSQILTDAIKAGYGIGTITCILWKGEIEIRIYFGENYF
jgi:hypothetical protein